MLDEVTPRWFRKYQTRVCDGTLTVTQNRAYAALVILTVVAMLWSVYASVADGPDVVSEMWVFWVFALGALPGVAGLLTVLLRGVVLELDRDAGEIRRNGRRVGRLSDVVEVWTETVGTEGDGPEQGAHRVMLEREGSAPLRVGVTQTRNPSVILARDIARHLGATMTERSEYGVSWRVPGRKPRAPMVGG